MRLLNTAINFTGPLRFKLRIGNNIRVTLRLAGVLLPFVGIAAIKIRSAPFSISQHTTPLRRDLKKKIDHLTPGVNTPSGPTLYVERPWPIGGMPRVNAGGAVRREGR